MELYVKNALEQRSFPFLSFEMNDRESAPPRQRFSLMHWHDDLELVYVLRGTIRLLSLPKAAYVNAGEAALINKRVLHKITASPGCRFRVFIFPDTLVRFSPGSPMDRAVLSVTGNMHLLTRYMFPGEESHARVLRLDEAVFGAAPPEPYRITSCIVNFMDALLRAERPACPGPMISTENHLSLQASLVFIHHHFKEDITLKDIASFGNVSVGQCTKLFKAYLNTTPYDYLLNHRVEKSMDLIQGSPMNITEIATRVGFNNASRFIQCFKEKTGVTPTGFRKELS